MTNSALYDKLVTEGFITSELFYEMAEKFLTEEHGLTQDDSENMSYDDLRDAIATVFNVTLEETEDGKVSLIEFCK